MYDTKNKKGIIYNKIVYQKYGKKDLLRAMENIDLSADSDHHSDLQPLLSEDEIKSTLLFFRTCVVQHQKDTLKEKMKQTVDVRVQLIKKKGVKFFELFPFYFIDPELVCSNLFAFLLELIFIKYIEF